ncbi:MAG TPA: PPOX class F420-dependent oxidoreductase [Nitriliruptorales bacterium]|nr:PPOX class F420-dependent oxidoreductase [Nitriliruptorales bacterium]
MPTDVIPESHRDLLDAPGFAHLASLGPDGAPQSHPVWYDFEDGRVVISTTKNRQKYRNVTRDERVALSILDPENPYRYLEIRGRVVSIEDDPEKRLVDDLAGKYLGVDEYPDKQPGAERVIISIEPEHAATMG